MVTKDGNEKKMSHFLFEQSCTTNSIHVYQLSIPVADLKVRSSPPSFECSGQAVFYQTLSIFIDIIK